MPKFSQHITLAGQTTHSAVLSRGSRLDIDVQYDVADAVLEPLTQR